MTTSTVRHLTGTKDADGAQACRRCGALLTEPGLTAFPPDVELVVEENAGKYGLLNRGTWIATPPELSAVPLCVAVH